MTIIKAKTFSALFWKFDIKKNKNNTFPYNFFTKSEYFSALKSNPGPLIITYLTYITDPEKTIKIIKVINPIFSMEFENVKIVAPIVVLIRVKIAPLSEPGFLFK